jgi:hypothetical protein
MTEIVNRKMCRSKRLWCNFIYIRPLFDGLRKSRNTSVREALLLLSIMGTYVPNFMKTRQYVGTSKEDTLIHAHKQKVGLFCFLKDNRKRHEAVGKQSYWCVM